MTNRRAVLLGALLAATLPIMGMARPPLPAMEGQLAYRLGQYPKAETLFAQAATEDPDARVWQGRAAAQQGHAEQAIAIWQLAAGDKRVTKAANAALGETRELIGQLGELLDRYSALRAGQPQAADWRALAAQFDALARQAGATLIARRAGLMAADAYAQAGDKAEALRRFEAAKDQHPLVADWALWRMASLDAQQGDDDLRDLVARYPDSPLLQDAKVALAEHEPDAAKRRQQLAQVVADGGQGPAAERALYLLGKEPGANQAQTLVRYWNAYPEGTYLDEVVHGLMKIPGLSADTNYRIGSYLYFESEYGPATQYFAKVRSPMSLYRMGRSFWGSNDLNRAVSTLKQVINADSSLAGKAYLTIGQVEAQRGAWPKAIDAYNLAARYGGEAGVTARWKLSRIYRDRHDDAKARQLEHAIIAQSPWSEEATSILWNEFWAAYQGGRSDDALVNGQRLAQHHPNHPSGQAAQYWLGRLYERLGQPAKAQSTYQALVGRAPTSYYGWRANWRSQALAGRGQDPWFATVPGRDIEEPPIRWQDLLGPQERALVGGRAGTELPKEMLDWPDAVRELVFLRQFDVAESYAASAAKSPNLKAWMSFLQMRYRQSIREEKGEPRLAYPLGYAPMLVGAARKQGVDPLLLAALVREESRFDASAKSWVGAVGLAQLMPETASWVAKNVPEVAGKPLNDPGTNLQLGAWYLAHTHKVFDGGSMYAVAAYNGGPGAVSKWRRGFRGEPDEFVENIPYPETREYVRKVFSSYWNYVRLYGGK